MAKSSVLITVWGLANALAGSSGFTPRFLAWQIAASLRH